MEPIYTPENTTTAYQLNWSLALFGKCALPDQSVWLKELQATTESDGVRTLTSNLRSENSLQFFVSTRPASAPSEIVRSIKGRLQYLIRDQIPKAFRRNYHIQSIGEVNSSVLDQYVAGQTARHPMADASVQSRLEAAQFHDNAVDLSKPFVGTYGQYLNSLQIVLENAQNWHEVCETQLTRVRNMIVRACRKKEWMLSRIGLLSNHVHILLGAGVTESPQSVALSLMNNVAYVYDMRPILKFSYYAGTFGGYDRGVVRLHEQGVAGSAEASPNRRPEEPEKRN